MHRTINALTILFVSLLFTTASAQDTKPVLTGMAFLVNGTSIQLTSGGTITLELQFNMAMDQSSNAHPKIFYSLDSSYSLPLPINGTWVSDVIWRGVFVISDAEPATENGFYNFQIQSAKSAAGIEMASTPGTQQLGICRPDLMHTESLSFTDTPPGLSRRVGLMLYNLSCTDLTIDSVKAAAPFSILEGMKPKSIPAKDSLEISVLFSPLDRGTYTDEVLIYSRQLADSPRNVTVAANAKGPVLSLDKTQLDFGRVEKDQDSTQIFIIKNLQAEDATHDDNLHFELEMYPDSLIYSVTPTMGDIAPGDSAEIAVTFRPTKSKIYNEYYILMTTNDLIQEVTRFDLAGYTSNQLLPTSIVDLQVDWGDEYSGYINQNGLHLCWEIADAETRIAQIRWKFSQQELPPTDNDDLGKGGALNLGDNQNCASLSLSSISQGNWYAFIWLVDSAGNSGYEAYTTLRFKYDTTKPATPSLVQSNIPLSAWLVELDSVEVKLKLASISRVDLLDIAHVYIKFNELPQSGYDYAELNDIGSVQNGIAAFKFAFNPTKCGPGNMYFWVSDSAGNFSSLEEPLALAYKIDTCPPEVTGMANTEFISAIHGKAFRDTVHISDERGVKNVWVEYRPAGTLSSKSNDDTRQIFGTTDFIITIPQEDIPYRGLEYRIMAKDSTDRIAFAPPVTDCADFDSGWVALPTYVGGAGPAPHDANGNNISLLKGTDSTDYQLISIPYDLKNPQIDSIFVDDLGTRKINTWRLFDYDTHAPAGQRWLEGDTARPFIPGRSYFLITNTKNQEFYTGPGKTRRTLCPDSIEIFEGWNLVATPFDFAVDTSDLSLVNSNSEIVLYAFDAGWEIASAMQPWSGYALYITRAAGSSSADPMYLVVQPYEATLGSAKTSLSDAAASTQDWAIQISAWAGKSRDLHNWIGVRHNSAAGFDDLERAEPPLIGRYVSVSFVHPEWHQLTDRFSTDFRAPDLDEFVWEIDVRCNATNEIVKLAFDFDANVPQDADVYLIDEEQQRVHDVRTENYYEFVAKANGSKKLKLAVGNAEFVKKAAGDLGLIPQDFAVMQNFPNPFNPETTLRFNLPEDGRVRVTVFNQLGQKVATPIDNAEMPAGYHSLIWRATGSNGKDLPSGIYFARVQFGNEMVVKKMLLLR
ncbi:MAG: T9SS type A sorting domain-containing protein [Deferribacteres bacterium]|nr:T9SS type A sorting domain-containing protein [candidate division KSB1 bacterium]MCB9504027.1 T9SS type A sorting domain-containing protein [Deferribacteres bacterium]